MSISPAENVSDLETNHGPVCVQPPVQRRDIGIQTEKPGNKCLFLAVFLSSVESVAIALLLLALFLQEERLASCEIRERNCSVAGGIENEAESLIPIEPWHPKLEFEISNEYSGIVNTRESRATVAPA